MPKVTLSCSYSFVIAAIVIAVFLFDGSSGCVYGKQRGLSRKKSKHFFFHVTHIYIEGKQLRQLELSNACYKLPCYCNAVQNI